MVRNCVLKQTIQQINKRSVHIWVRYPLKKESSCKTLWCSCAKNTLNQKEEESTDNQLEPGKLLLPDNLPDSHLKSCNTIPFSRCHQSEEIKDGTSSEN